MKLLRSTLNGKEPILVAQIYYALLTRLRKVCITPSQTLTT